MARPRRSDVIIPEMPSTLHAPCSMRNSDGDMWASQRDIDTAIESATWAAIDEKVDGAHLAVRFVNGVPHLRQRSHMMSKSFIARTPHQAQLAPAWAWFHERKQHFELLAHYLGYEPVVHGEWLLGRHGVKYDALPALWLAFDIMDERCELFMPHAAARDTLNRAGIIAVPTLVTGTPCDVVPVLAELAFGPSQFSTVGCAREGAYIRFGDEHATFARFKVLPDGAQRGLTLNDAGQYERNSLAIR